MNDIKSFLTQKFPNEKIDTNHRSPILSPNCDSDIVQVVTLAQEHDFKICPVGTMTHIDPNDIGDDVMLISSRKLDHIIEYSPGGLYLTVGAGMPLGNLSSICGDDNLRFPFDCCDYDGTIGGAVALGIRLSTKYRDLPIKRWVPSLSFVTPYGKIVKVGAVTLKSVTGYDITKLLVGSRGKLGFITSVTLRLVSQSQMQDFDGAILDSVTSVVPKWGDPPESYSPVERDLKTNLDPNSIFPT